MESAVFGGKFESVTASQSAADDGDFMDGVGVF